MTKRSVLYLIDPMPHNSPFDINMAVEAGFDLLFPLNNVKLEEVEGLTQDAIFSRGPEGVKKTAMFIGGRDISLAMHMLEATKRAMVPPFEFSVLADPSGAFTTAAALVALVEKQLKEKHQKSLKDCRAVIFGGTGPVGIASAIIASQSGAQTTIVDHASLDNALEKADTYNKMFKTSMKGTCAVSEADKIHLLHHADIVFCTAKAGVQVLSASTLEETTHLLVAADVNAVPPLGIEGIKRHDLGAPLIHATLSPNAVGIGALAVGDLKYKLQIELLRQLLGREEPIFYDFREAFKIAQKMA